MSTHTPPTFNQDDTQRWKSFLDIHGYVVLNNILPSETKETFMVNFKQEWCLVAEGFSWDDQSTWTSKNIPLMLSKGMAVFSGWGHSNFMWNLLIRKSLSFITGKLF